MLPRTVEINNQIWVLTNHAQKRMSEMGIDVGQLVLTISKPEVDYCSSGRGKHSDGGRTAQRGDLAVVYKDSERVVLTLLHRTQSKYRRAA